MLCDHCGKELPENVNFCEECGLAVTAGQDGLSAAEEVSEQTVETPASADEMSEVMGTGEDDPDATREAPLEQPCVAADAEQAVPTQAQFKRVKPRKKRPPMVLRVFMQLLSLVLCLVLVGTLVAGVLLLDLRQLTSSKGLETIIKAFMSGTTETAVPDSAQAPTPIPAVPGTKPGHVAVSLSDSRYDFNVDEVPEDLLTGGNSAENINSLIDWFYQEIQDTSEKPLEFTKEELREFVEESTVSDYMSEKLAGFAQDFINGTETTAITTEELMQLMEENEEILEHKLNIRLTEADRQSLTNTFNEVVVENNLNATIRDSLNEAMNSVLQDTVGVDIASFRELILRLTADTVLYIVLGICLLLVLLLCGLNYYNVGAGLTWSASAGILAGGLVCLPLLVLEFGRDMLVEMVPELAGVMGTVDSVFIPLTSIHYGLLYGSLAIFVLSVVWRIVASVLNSRRPAAV